MVSIIEYEEKYVADFREMNMEWLQKFNLLEPADVLVLDNPKHEILDKGGYIFLAIHDGVIVGSAALLNEHNDVYEFAKMCVRTAFQRRGIAKLLIENCLQKAKQVSATKIILYSNSQLQTAIGLYEQYGFKHIPVTDSPFVSADVKMVLSL